MQVTTALLILCLTACSHIAQAAAGTTSIGSTAKAEGRRGHHVEGPAASSSTLFGGSDSSKIQNDSKKGPRQEIGAESEESSDADEFLATVRSAGRQLRQVEHDSDGHETNYIAECHLPSVLGDFRMRAYTYREGNDQKNKLEPVVMVMGDVDGQEDVLVRVHDQCFTSEVFGSKRCDCREQLEESLKMIKEEFVLTGKGGILIYLQQEGRGIGLPNKIAAYSLQDQGMDTVDANTHLGFADEMREYVAVPDILDDMDVRSVRLITNNPYKVDQLEKLGVKITDRISVELESNEHNLKYLRTKKMRMNHALSKKGLERPSTDGKDASSIPVEAFDEVNMDSKTGKAKGYTEDMGRSSVKAALQAIAEGKMVLVVDDANRENEGDFIMAAEKATPEAIGFMIRHSSGVLCASIESSRLDRLNLPPMVTNNQDPKGTAYTVSVDAKQGTSTGISASDRALTFRTLADPAATADDFYRPGHVFPLRYTRGGTLVRAGHTEATLDLCKAAGCQPVGVLCEVVHDDGSMQRLPDLKLFAAEHGLILTSIQDLVAYRLETER